MGSKEDERWRAHRREHDIHENAHRREHEQYKERVQAASNTMELRLAGMNEFREQLTAERATYVTRRELDGVLEIQRVKGIEERRFRVLVTVSIGVSMFSAVVAIIIAVVS